MSPWHSLSVTVSPKTSCVPFEFLNSRAAQDSHAGSEQSFDLGFFDTATVIRSLQYSLQRLRRETDACQKLGRVLWLFHCTTSISHSGLPIPDDLAPTFRLGQKLAVAAERKPSSAHPQLLSQVVV